MLICCIKKDLAEYFRGRKNIFNLIAVITIGAFVMVITLSFPSLISHIIELKPSIITDTGSVGEFIQGLFPNDVKSSLGIFSSDIAVFYTIIGALTSYHSIPDEIKSGRWILPIEKGYSQESLLLSKVMVISLGSSFPVFFIYMLYYFVSLNLLQGDCLLSTAFCNAAVLSLCILLTSCFSVMLSVIYSRCVLAAVSVILFVLVVPDVMTIFSFGKYLPSYLFTFTYNTQSSFEELLIPILIAIILLYTTFLLAVKRIKEVSYER